MRTLLYTSAEIRRAIIDLFSKGTGRRVAISAFVGEGAEAYLPNPKGIELICWPKEGGTNPNVLRRLMKKGVAVRFSDNMHIKLYWAEGQDAVLTSANLSNHALGAGNLKELGTLLRADSVDIDRIVQSLKPRKPTDKEVTDLDRRHNLYYAHNKVRDVSSVPSFLEWHGLPARPKWKFAWWDEEAKGSSMAAKEIAKTEYRLTEPHNYLFVERREYRDGDWILMLKLKKRVGSSSWLFVDRVVSVDKKDKVFDPDTPYELIQLWPLKNYPAPPFRLDNVFRKALSKAVMGFGVDKLKDLNFSTPPDAFVETIRQGVGKG